VYSGSGLLGVSSNNIGDIVDSSSTMCNGE